MSTATTVRLSDEERELLSELADEYGSQTGAIRRGLLLLAREGSRSSLVLLILTMDSRSEDRQESRSSQLLSSLF